MNGYSNRKRAFSKRYAKGRVFKTYRPYSNYSSLVPRFTQKAYSRSRKLNSNLQQVKLTTSNKVVLPAGFNAYVWTHNSASWWNLNDIMNTCSEFTTRTAQYAYYKLNGLSVKFTRRWLNSLGAGSISTPGFQEADLGLGLPMLSVNFFPSIQSTALTTVVEQADTSMKISPFTTDCQTYYIKFPRNFTQGPNASGLGTWNTCNSINNLTGQISIANDGAGAAASAFGHVFVFDVEVNFYASFCNNTGA